MSRWNEDKYEHEYEHKHECSHEPVGFLFWHITGAILTDLKINCSNTEMDFHDL
jgi:hypothetical protein